jgi:hypothetical protein
MARFACIRTSDNSFFLPERFRHYESKPGDLPNKGLKWLPAPIVAQPAYDEATHVLTGPFYSIGEAEVTESWTVREKTAQEIDDEKTSRVNSYDRLAFEIAFDMENRVRVLEGRASVTRAQYRTALKARL